MHSIYRLCSSPAAAAHLVVALHVLVKLHQCIFLCYCLLLLLKIANLKLRSASFLLCCMLFGSKWHLTLVALSAMAAIPFTEQCSITMATATAAAAAAFCQQLTYSEGTCTTLGLFASPAECVSCVSPIADRVRCIWHHAWQ